VINNFLGQNLLVLQGSDHIICADPIGFAGPGDVVKIQIGQGGSNGIAVLVEHRMMHQSYGQIDCAIFVLQYFFPYLVLEQKLPSQWEGLGEKR
jgi:hypothetical protein